MPTITQDPWLMLDKADPLLYEKEVLPVGNLTRWVGDDKEVIHANIKRPFLDRVVKHFETFKKRGIAAHFFKTHVEHPDNNQGDLKEVFVKPNSKGVESLHVRVKFHDEKARDDALKNEVSALIPQKYVDNKNNVYDHAMRHVASTASAVVQGLDDWKGPLVLSFDTPSGLMLAEPPTPPEEETEEEEGDLGMKINQIASKVGATVGANDEATLDAILAKLNEQPAEEEEEEVETGALNLSIPPVMMAQFRKAREGIIDALVLDTTITPSLAAELKKTYCSDDSCKADLQLDTAETEFDRAIELARKVAKDRPLKNTGRTTLKLDKSDAPNPLLEDAKKRAERAAKKTG